MNRKIEMWCYGGQSKAFFIKQSDAIHQYNTVMMNRLLLVMTIVLGCYVVTEISSANRITHYVVAYSVSFALLLVMLLIFKLKKEKSIPFIRTYIILFASIMFAFVCLIGTVFEPNARAIMVMVYLLALPMMLVIPTHFTYGFLIAAGCVFSITSLMVKDIMYANMDVSHTIVCLVIGIFMSHHILESRMALYAANNRLDVRNIQLDRQLQEKEVQLLQSRISIMLTQIQPHFLFNTLSAICGLCDENPKEAKKVTAQFSDYLRHNLESLNQSAPIPFEKELCHTQAYLEIEQKRFPEKLNIAYDIQAEDFYLPSLTMQPIVENAVKHGVMKRKVGGTVTVSTREREDCYEIIIADDGAGFDQNKLQADDKRHIGIQNVRDRLYIMCMGTLTIKSEIDCGTTATINIPKGDTI